MKRLAIGFGILISLLLIANGTMAWWTESKLQARLDAIRAAGHPASIADLAPTPIPDEENAAAHIEKLTPLIKEFDRDCARFYDKTPLGKAYNEARNRGELPTAEQAAAMRKILDKYSAINEGVAKAAACKQFASRGDFSVRHNEFIEQAIERVQNFRGVARYLAWQSQVLAEEGEIDEAIARGLTLLRLARLHEGEPMLMSHLVSIAVQGVAVEGLYDALSAGPVSPEVHAAIDQEVRLQDDPRQFARVLRSERGYAMNTLDLMPGQQVNPTLFNMVSWPMKRMYFGALDHYDELLAAADGPWIDFREQVEDGGALAAPTGHGVLADLLTPAISAAVHAEDQSTALLRSLRIYNALRQYAEVHGCEAAGVADLKLPVDSTLDPFSGKSLMMRRVADDWLVYSVGRNGVDDGGEIFNGKDVGVGPRKAGVEVDATDEPTA